MMVRPNLKVHPRMLTLVLQGERLGEDDVLPYWALEVSFHEADIFHPTTVVVVIKVFQLCA